MCSVNVYAPFEELVQMGRVFFHSVQYDVNRDVSLWQLLGALAGYSRTVIMKLLHS